MNVLKKLLFTCTLLSIWLASIQDTFPFSTEEELWVSSDEMADISQVAPNATLRFDAWPKRGELLRGRMNYGELADKVTSMEGVLTLTWTDAIGRVMYRSQERKTAINSISLFTVPTDRALTSYNRLRVEFQFDTGETAVGEGPFFVTPPVNPLDDYTVIMYYPYKPHQQASLRKFSIYNGKIQPQTRISPFTAPAIAEPWYSQGFGNYIDQTAVPFLSPYHSPAYEPKHLKLMQAKEEYLKDRTNKKPFIREPSFFDEEAIAEHMSNLTMTVKNQRHLRPLFITTDETGVADLLTAWDFDFDPRALVAFREWLRAQYGSLDALNNQWETSFPNWQEVMPFTTDEMITRGGTNYAPWADHRHFMNKAFTDAIKLTSQTIHAAAPEAFAGIVGGQAPSAFGGYDYWLLSGVIDMIEPYNLGNSRELWRSFAPEKPAFMTAFGSSDSEVWRHWYQTLHGDRGVIIYDEENRFLDDECNVTDYGKPFVPLYSELTGGIVKQIAQAKPVQAQVAIHYSHPSITAMWMRQNTSGYNWLNHGSGREYMYNDFLRLRESFTKVLEDNYIPWEFVAYRQLELSQLLTKAPKVFILPQSIAMSADEIAAVKDYVQAGGIVIADAMPAIMDEHCTTLPSGRLDDLFGIRRLGAIQDRTLGLIRTDEADTRNLAQSGQLELSVLEQLELVNDAQALYRNQQGNPAYIVRSVGKGLTIYLNIDITDYHHWRLEPPKDAQLRQLFAAIFAHAGVSMNIQVTREDGSRAHGLECFEYPYGKSNMYAFHRNFQIKGSDLGPAALQNAAALTGDWLVDVTLPVSGAIYNARTGVLLGTGNKVRTQVPEYTPLILSVVPEPVRSLSASLAPVNRGGWISATIALEGGAAADAHIINVRVEGPENAFPMTEAHNVVVRDGKGYWEFPVAENQAPGKYTLHIRDALTGVSAKAEFSLK